jgi:hypothetical protein
MSNPLTIVLHKDLTPHQIATSLRIFAGIMEQSDTQDEARKQLKLLADMIGETPAAKKLLDEMSAGEKQKRRILISDEESDNINRLVEPFVKAERQVNHHPTTVGMTERGVVITLHDASKILVRTYQPGEKIPQG